MRLLQTIGNLERLNKAHFYPAILQQFVRQKLVVLDSCREVILHQWNMLLHRQDILFRNRDSFSFDLLNLPCDFKGQIQCELGGFTADHRGLLLVDAFDEML